jgi:sugar phosphate isomerase/epimerase
MGIQLVVENHGHPGSNGAWLAMLVEKTAHKNLGVYLDLDNFFMGGWGIEPERRYDRKQGVLDLAEYTVGVSAKTKHFLPDGTEEFIDYDWCVNTLLERGFSGYMSAEYEGHALSNWKGSKATVRLLQSLQLKFTA